MFEGEKMIDDSRLKCVINPSWRELVGIGNMAQELGNWPWDTDFGISGMNYNIIGKYEQ